MVSPEGMIILLLFFFFFKILGEYAVGVVKTQREVVAGCVFSQHSLGLNLFFSDFLLLKEKPVSSPFSIIICLFY